MGQEVSQEGAYEPSDAPFASQSKREQRPNAAAAEGSVRSSVFNWAASPGGMEVTVAQEAQQLRLNAGQKVEAKFHEDGLWYMARIESFTPDKRILVTFTEYGNQQICTINEIRPVVKYRVGMLVDARYSEDDEWYRAEVIEGADEDGLIAVRFTEYGNEQLCGRSVLRPLQADIDKKIHAEVQRQSRMINPSEIKDSLARQQAANDMWAAATAAANAPTPAVVEPDEEKASGEALQQQEGSVASSYVSSGAGLMGSAFGFISKSVVAGAEGLINASESIAAKAAAISQKRAQNIQLQKLREQDEQRRSAVMERRSAAAATIAPSASAATAATEEGDPFAVDTADFDAKMDAFASSSSSEETPLAGGVQQNRLSSTSFLGLSEEDDELRASVSAGAANAMEDDDIGISSSSDDDSSSDSSSESELPLPPPVSLFDLDDEDEDGASTSSELQLDSSEESDYGSAAEHGNSEEEIAAAFEGKSGALASKRRSVRLSSRAEVVGGAAKKQGVPSFLTRAAPCTFNELLEERIDARQRLMRLRRMFKQLQPDIDVDVEEPVWPHYDPLPVGEEYEAAQHQQREEWRAGDECEAVWFEDNMWYLAKIESMEMGNDGEPLYMVVFTEYGNKQPETPLDAIRPVTPLEVLAEKGLIAEGGDSLAKLNLEWLQRDEELGAGIDALTRKIKRKDAELASLAKSGKRAEEKLIRKLTRLQAELLELAEQERLWLIQQQEKEEQRRRAKERKEKKKREKAERKRKEKERRRKEAERKKLELQRQEAERKRREEIERVREEERRRREEDKARRKREKEQREREAAERRRREEEELRRKEEELQRQREAEERRLREEEERRKRREAEERQRREEAERRVREQQAELERKKREIEEEAQRLQRLKEEAEREIKERQREEELQRRARQQQQEEEAKRERERLRQEALAAERRRREEEEEERERRKRAEESKKREEEEKRQKEEELERQLTEDLKREQEERAAQEKERIAAMERKEAELRRKRAARDARKRQSVAVVASAANEKWHAGDECEAVWFQDNQWYLAEILRKGSKPNCYDVRFPEYGNEQENTPLLALRMATPSELLPADVRAKSHQLKRTTGLVDEFDEFMDEFGVDASLTEEESRESSWSVTSKEDDARAGTVTAGDDDDDDGFDSFVDVVNADDPAPSPRFEGLVSQFGEGDAATDAAVSADVLPTPSELADFIDMTRLSSAPARKPQQKREPEQHSGALGLDEFFSSSSEEGEEDAKTAPTKAALPSKVAPLKMSRSSAAIRESEEEDDDFDLQQYQAQQQRAGAALGGSANSIARPKRAIAQSEQRMQNVFADLLDADEPLTSDAETDTDLELDDGFSVDYAGRVEQEERFGYSEEDTPPVRKKKPRPPAAQARGLDARRPAAVPSANLSAALDSSAPPVSPRLVSVTKYRPKSVHQRAQPSRRHSKPSADALAPPSVPAPVPGGETKRAPSAPSAAVTGGVRMVPLFDPKSALKTLRKKPLPVKRANKVAVQQRPAPKQPQKRAVPRLAIKKPLPPRKLRRKLPVAKLKRQPASPRSKPLPKQPGVKRKGATKSAVPRRALPTRSLPSKPPTSPGRRLPPPNISGLRSRAGRVLPPNLRDSSVKSRNSAVLPALALQKAPAPPSKQQSSPRNVAAKPASPRSNKPMSPRSNKLASPRAMPQVSPRTQTAAPVSVPATTTPRQRLPAPPGASQPVAEVYRQLSALLQEWESASERDVLARGDHFFEQLAGTRGALKQLHGKVGDQLGGAITEWRRLNKEIPNRLNELRLAQDAAAASAGAGAASASPAATNPPCSSCHAPLEGKTLKWQGLEFHSRCFVCSVCSTSLKGRKCLKLEDKPYCETCGKKAFALRLRQRKSGAQRVKRKVAPQKGAKSKSAAELLAWVQGRVAPFGFEVHNFKESWEDGVLFCALLHSFVPQAIALEDLECETKEQWKANIALALKVGEHLGVAAIITPHDIVDVKRVEPATVISYINMVRRTLDPPQ